MAFTTTSIVSSANFHRLRVHKAADTDIGVVLPHGLAREVLVLVEPTAYAAGPSHASHLLPNYDYTSTNVVLSFSSLASSSPMTWDVVVFGHSVIATDTA